MRREVETRRFARDGVLQGRSTLTEGLGRILAAALLPFLVVIGFLSFAGVASAQTAPDQVSAYVDSLGVHVRITACQVAPYGDQTKTNCYNFGIYRNPPGFDKPAIGTAYLINSSSITFTDPGSSNLQVGQSYSYRVCTNVYPDNTGSNCKTTSAVTIPPHTVEQPPAVTLTADATNIPKGAETNLSWTSANATSLDLEPFVGKVNPSGWTTVAPQQTTTYTLTASGPGGKTTANATINVFCPTPTVPEPVDAFGGPSGIELKWTNPNTPAGQSCPVPSNQVLIYRLGPGENTNA
ncbi:MAG TPA: hypothetical protein VGU63_05340 [Candidatus Acidoferrales bacterium]|nr:hypothetical protein [Candidatus Acidoferrales bacterium]